MPLPEETRRRARVPLGGEDHRIASETSCVKEPQHGTLGQFGWGTLSQRFFGHNRSSCWLDGISGSIAGEGSARYGAFEPEV